MYVNFNNCMAITSGTVHFLLVFCTYQTHHSGNRIMNLISYAFRSEVSGVLQLDFMATCSQLYLPGHYGTLHAVQQFCSQWVNTCKHVTPGL